MGTKREGAGMGHRKAAAWGWAALVAGALVATPVAAQEPLRFGLFIEVTGGGAGPGEAAQLAAQVAVRDINAMGGIAGRKLEAVLADTQSDPTVGVGEIKRLVLQEKVAFVAGPLFSQV